MAAYPTMNDLPPELIRHAQHQACPTRVPVRWGLLAAEFDPAEGWLRSVRLKEREVVRAIYGAVRDRNWGTVPPRVHGLRIEQEDRAFRVLYEVECRAPEIDFRWRSEISGDADGVLTFRFAGEALTAFWKNRIGLCVLHPVEGCAGESCQVETVGGGVVESKFPHFIAPHQPFIDVRAISHQVAPGLRVEVRFAGEVFETEDQRNWTDASFKTYSTPLAEPFPRWIERGTRVEQTVTVRLVGADRIGSSPSESAECAELSVTDTAAKPLPSIGFGTASHGAALTPVEVARLRRLRPTHLRVDLPMRNTAWLTRWRQAGGEAAAIGAALHAAVFLSDNAGMELAALAAEFSAHPQPVALWLIFHESQPVTSVRWLRMAEAALPAGAILAAGTNANFAELNRARPAAEETALPCFSINPQVHAFDDASLIENLGAQAATVESARQFAPRPVVISTITLRPRFNAVATADQASTPQALPSPVDARQMSLFAAAWTAGSLARLAPLDGLHSVTYFETTGQRGVMETAGGSPMPGLFPSLPGGVFPLFHVFAALAEGKSILPTRSTHPLLFDGFCIIGRAGLRRWGVANLTAGPGRVRVVVGGSTATVRTLNEDNAARAMGEPEDFTETIRHPTPSGILELELKAYAFAQITVES